MRFKESKEAILSEIEYLRNYKKLIVVEGEHDKDALQKLGLERIFILNKIGVSLFARIEDLFRQLHKKESCVILTDLDKKGKSYYKLLKRELTKQGFRTDSKIREMLIRTRVSHIEGLATFLGKKEIF